MLRNADSAKENEDPYSGRMSLIERCNGQSAFGNACDIVASAENLFFPVATMLQAFPKAFGSSCSFRRNFLAGFIPTSNSRYEGPNEILMGFLRLDRRRTGGAKRLHTITWIRFIPNRSLEHLTIRHYKFRKLWIALMDRLGIKDADSVTRWRRAEGEGWRE